jgi:hypothetical protein
VQFEHEDDSPRWEHAIEADQRDRCFVDGNEDYFRVTTPSYESYRDFFSGDNLRPPCDPSSRATSP